jgi:serine/threonine protein kinase
VKAGESLGSFVLVEELGRGPSASTWLAREAGGGEASALPGTGATGERASGDGQRRVVLKILDLSETSSWGAVDVFRRESEALSHLHHPAIPAFLGSFESESEGKLRLVLAMERVDGLDLEKIVNSGRKFSESEIEGIMAQLCDVLAYLGSLRPPIVHRDINPRNIVLKADGTIVLVDFSGVQDAVRSALFPGATLVGTAGYIPLEQVGGKASHRSDLYGAAATAVFLLTGRNPAELPTRALKIDLSGIVEVSPGLSALLSSWLEPDVLSRNLSAAKAAALLRGEEEALVQAQNQNAAKTASTRSPAKVWGSEYPKSLPADSRVQIESSLEGVKIILPPAGFRNSSRPLRSFSILWIGFIAFWTFMSMRMRAPFFFTLFSLPFWGVGVFLAKTALAPSLSTRELSVTREKLSLRSTIFGVEKLSSWPLSDVGPVSCIPSRLQFQGANGKELSVEAGTGHARFGSGLSDRELLYLERFLDGEIERLRGG